jgi:hypothetical protein
VSILFRAIGLPETINGGEDRKKLTNRKYFCKFISHRKQNMGKSQLRYAFRGYLYRYETEPVQSFAGNLSVWWRVEEQNMEGICVLHAAEQDVQGAG